MSSPEGNQPLNTGSKPVIRRSFVSADTFFEQLERRREEKRIPITNQRGINRRVLDSLLAAREAARNTKAKQFVPKEIPTEPAHFTSNEIELIRLLATGEGMGAIPHKLNMQPPSVYLLKESVETKIKKSSKDPIRSPIFVAIAQCVEKGLITIGDFEPEIELKKDEVTILNLLLKGHPVSEIASILDCYPLKILGDIADLHSKFRAGSYNQLVAKFAAFKKSGGTNPDLV